jgi:hypothetical protein
LMLVFGVFLGSTLWRFILSRLVHFVWWKMDQDILIKINKISGICLMWFGLFLMISLFFV